MAGKKKSKRNNNKSKNVSTPAAVISAPPDTDVLVPQDNNNKENASPSVSPDQQQQKQAIAERYRVKGNEYMKSKDYAAAIQAYSSGLQQTIDESMTVTLWSNRSLAHLRQNEFLAAEADCTRILERDTGHAKAWYRRAQAREGRASQQMSNNETDSSINGTSQVVEDLLMAALFDLDKGEACCCMEGTEADIKSPQRNDMIASIHLRRDRIQALLLQSCRKADWPDAKKQRESVLLLLSNRKACLSDDTIVLEGEAFFLLDWTWWCTWCQFVGLSDESNQLMPFLLPGSSKPVLEGDNDAIQKAVRPPNVIDNSRLLLSLPDRITPETSSQIAFYMDWYRDKYHNENTTSFQNSQEGQKADGNNSADEETNEDQPTILRPHLVRGYHYEILPREVYAALVNWYGESTPSLCRRVVKTSIKDMKVLHLYPGRRKKINSILGSSVEMKCAACGACRAVSRCRRCMKARYCNRSCQEAHWTSHKIACNAAVKNPDSHEIKFLSVNGQAGLNNLGNTCFMNSALQALSHARPLTQHFLSGRFKADLNPNNPLGTQGRLATAYSSVLRDLWWGYRKSASPTELKRAIALFAPRFAGFAQHDTQEFLAYLLDGLHEDLNRIRKAPYVEMPDVTDGQNMSVAGARAWDAHCRRNDSVVLDTFYGQFKSTCVCPQCQRVSVSFDAFNHVSLEIPRSTNGALFIFVLVFDMKHNSTAPAMTPTRYGIELDHNSSVAELKQRIADMSQMDVKRLVLCEILDHQISEFIQPNKSVARIRPTDIIAAYEVDGYNEAYHAVANHCVVEGTDIQDLEIKNIGFPFTLCVKSTWTCRKLWDVVWQKVRHLVIDECRSEDDVRSLLQIKLHSQGKPLKMIPVGENGAKTDCLPAACEETLVSLFGSDSVGEILTLRLEWFSTHQRDNEMAPARQFDIKRFTEYQEHPSFSVVAERRQRKVSQKPTVTLDHCFQAFIKPERLDEDNKWYCSSCKEHVQALKTMELWRLPNVLIIHLKRFEFKHMFRRDKLDTFVSYPLNGLDMSRHCASSVPTGSSFLEDHVRAEYDLFAVTNHFGRMGYGHYTAYGRSWDENSGLSEDWHLFDDSSVHKVEDITKVVSSAAYVLFYRRRQFH